MEKKVIWPTRLESRDESDGGLAWKLADASVRVVIVLGRREVKGAVHHTFRSSKFMDEGREILK